jgi:hypothetical protein
MDREVRERACGPVPSANDVGTERRAADNATGANRPSEATAQYRAKAARASGGRAESPL